MSAASGESLAHVRDVIAVHSAKGGVGKSTLTTNLAVTLARRGMKVGLLDADVHGPSIGHMLGSSEELLVAPGTDRAQPVERHGVRYVSMANVAAEGLPIVWRGPMVSQALTQLLTAVEWGDLDLLLVDMPPGTGDAVLAIGQSVRLAGVVTITTPQEMSLSDTRRGIRAFEALQVPVLGLVENMAGFVCDGCGDMVPLFGKGGGERAAARMSIPFLGRIPLDSPVVPSGDAGTPIVESRPDALASRAFSAVAQAMLRSLAETGRSGAFDVTWRRMGPKERHEDPPGGAPRASEASPDTPLAVWQVADPLLGILWADGTRTLHGAFELRQACPCAGCIEEWTGRRMESLDAVPREVRPVTIRSVGRYALQPVWSDGHRTGIYTFRDLRLGAGALEER